MALYATDTIRRGQSGNGEFPVAEESDLKISYIVAASLSALQALPSWRRKSKMFGFAILENKEYQLQTDLTTWTDVTVSLPSNIVTEDEIFDSNGYIKSERIKNIYVNDSFVVASQAAMLGLTTVTGNVVIRTDTGAVYFKLNNDSPSDLSDFADITANTGAVTSVNGQTGVVNITIANLLAVGANLTAFNIAVASSPAVSANTTAIADLQSDVTDLSAVVDSVQDYAEGHLGTKQLSSTALDPLPENIGQVITWNGSQYTLSLIPVTVNYDKGYWSDTTFPDTPLTVRRNDYWDVPPGSGIYINGEFFAPGSRIQALTDSPGQDREKWKIY